MVWSDSNSFTKDTNRSKGYGFITFNEAEDAKKALEQMNGFELAGRPIKYVLLHQASFVVLKKIYFWCSRMGHVTDRTSEAALQQLANGSNGLVRNFLSFSSRL